ncbi:MAG: asparagine synthase (glutamine-hydrolyzing) [Planctomyces sp.]|nr:asparagine synthase (glutamine-hydrolyzing) [Planctomyces sp.]
MCGFAGFWQPVAARPLSAAALGDRAARMNQQLAHRGPDDDDVFVEAPAGLALGFRRLAIRDLSPAGRQPMTSASGQSVIAFNGEIYNAAELRAGLDASHRFQPRGGSDTEILLEAIEAWGLETALKKSVGMFALAVWDRRTRTLSLARDRFGEKPLYYGIHNGVLLFGSELRALRQHPAMRTDMHREALSQFARFGCVPGPDTIYRGTEKLVPGTFLTFRERDIPFSRIPRPQPYWDLPGLAQAGGREPFRGTLDEAAAQLERLLRRTIREQMVADVPLGAFLSGGIDSSLIVALMQAESLRPVRTFTIGFESATYDEAPYAEAVARHLRTDHTELYVTARETLDVVPRLPEIYDEPFADASQIPTCLVAALARRHVTVSLSGDGGDEIFGGYARYAALDRLWGAARWCPRVFRQAAAAVLRTGGVLERSRRGSPGRKLLHAARIVGQPTFDHAYRALLSVWADPSEVVAQGSVACRAFQAPEGGTLSRLRRMMLMDAATYLPDDILAKVDRATMAVGLESRAPLLDHRIAEFASKLPAAMLQQRGQGKVVLRQALERFVPRALFDRPKQGFGVPLGEWLRGPLRDWAEALLSRRRLADEGFWNPVAVQAAWGAHLLEECDASARLWPILMFQAWQERQQSAASRRQVA